MVRVMGPTNIVAQIALPDLADITTRIRSKLNPPSHFATSMVKATRSVSIPAVYCASEFLIISILPRFILLILQFVCSRGVFHMSPS